jgi:hypothetical protein
LNVDPKMSPDFGRVFENVDGLGHSAKNIYTRQDVGAPTPAQPIRVQWTVTRGQTVVDPQGNYSKSLNGQWVALKGTFVKWNFTIAINGVVYNVADYYLPQAFAANILASDPLVLDQEYFGAAEGILNAQRGTVRYTDMRAFDGTNWYPLQDWRITFRIDDEAGNHDTRFGWKSEGPSLTSSVGHESDITECSRDPGAAFRVLPTPRIASVTYDGNKTVTINGLSFGVSPTVLINNSDRTALVSSKADADIRLSAKPKRLGLQAGANKVQVVSADGVPSNIYVITL